MITHIFISDVYKHKDEVHTCIWSSPSVDGDPADKGTLSREGEKDRNEDC